MEDYDKTIEVIKAAMQKEREEKLNGNAMDAEKNKAEEAAAEDEACREDACAECVNDENEESGGAADLEASDKETVKPEKQGKSLLKGSKSKELAAKDAKIAELTDRLMRNMAEFDNFRKRTEREKSQMFELGARSIIEKMLPIIDNFERGMASCGDDKSNALYQGFELIYKQLTSVMEEIGVKPIDAVGKEFDPAYHNAVMHGEDENYGENIVAEEFLKGYMYNDIVIRHSMVKVVN